MIFIFLDLSVNTYFYYMHEDPKYVKLDMSKFFENILENVLF